MNEFLDKHWQKIMSALGVLTVSGGIGTYAVKGVTADAREEVRMEMRIKIDEKETYIRTLEDEVDKLQLDAVSIGFKYDMCCSTGGSCF